MTPLENYAVLFEFIDRWERGQAEFLGALLYDRLKPRRVVDWGCASGLYLLPFQARGCTVLGIDGDPQAGKKIPNSFMQADIRLPHPGVCGYDLALCIETAEHIREEESESLVRNVCSSAADVFWCAAHPYQGGKGHYNERTRDYWYGRCFENGMKMHPLHQEVLRAITLDKECQKVQWLISNAMLLTHRAESMF